MWSAAVGRTLVIPYERAKNTAITETARVRRLAATGAHAIAVAFLLQSLVIGPAMVPMALCLLCWPSRGPQHGHPRGRSS